MTHKLDSAVARLINMRAYLLWLLSSQMKGEAVDYDLLFIGRKWVWLWATMNAMESSSNAPWNSEVEKHPLLF